MGPDAQPETSLEAKSPFRSLFLVFLRLGLTSFGGPVAHIAFFREEFVKKRNWFSDDEYTDIVALCQFMPGPASSQTGMIIGLMRGGMPGMAAAWLGFTLPSALLMIGAGLGLTYADALFSEGAQTGLRVVVAGVVAHALFGMTRSLCPDWPRRIVALAAFSATLLLGSSLPHAVLILAGALVGWISLTPPQGRTAATLSSPIPRMLGASALVIFLILLIAPAISNTWSTFAFFDAFYRAGALVFGGGHVVLPLLDETVVQPGWMDADTFLAGYGLAQAVPGPLFTFAAFLGTTADAGPGGAVGGLLALLYIFLPSFLLVLGLVPFWSEARGSPVTQKALQGVNATVVGLLAATFVDPVLVNSIGSPGEAIAAAAIFGLLWWGKIPVWLIVAIGAGAGSLALG